MHTIILLAIIVLHSSAAVAENKLSTEQRQQIIRAFLAEHAFAHRTLPIGKQGIVIDGSRDPANVSPSEREAVQRGVAARAGERVDITGIRFEREGIVFEINGGAAKREKWSDHVRIGMGGPDVAPTQRPDETRPVKGGPIRKDVPQAKSPEPKGAFILLKLDNSAGITPERVRALLAPVLDFSSISQADAYQKKLSPVLTAALKEHRALVGMDRDMVLAAMGRPPRRLREISEGQEYEEWIYGSPPQDIEFIRFLRDKVVRIEQMKVTGEKLVRNQDEVGKVDGVLDASSPAVGAAPAMAAPAEPTSGVNTSSATHPNAAPPNAAGEAPRRKPPTLLRPGEAPPPAHMSVSQ